MILRVIALVLGSSCLSSSALAFRGDPKEYPAPPNILVIVLDDVGADQLSMYGKTPTKCLPINCDTLCNCGLGLCPIPHGACLKNTYARTPNLAALSGGSAPGVSGGGVRFTKFYANPLCSPTRAALLTGRHPFRTGMGWVVEPANVNCFELDDSELLIPELLKNGFPTDPVPHPDLPYNCGAFGKWHLALLENDATTSGIDNLAHATDNGFDRFYGSMQNTRLHFNWWKVEHNLTVPPSTPSTFLLSGTTPYTAEFWNADVNRRDAATWINAQTKAFFAYVAFNPPHANLRVPPLLAHPASANRPLLSDDTLCELECTFGNSYVPGDPPVVGSNAATNLRHRQLVYRAMLEAVDSEIGLLLEDIDDEKLANTMIFVVGDNGTPGNLIHDPPHEDLHGKATIYDGGTRAPMIVAGPIVPTGGHASAVPIAAVDLWRTIGEIASADETLASPPYTIDSQSFLEYIVDPTETPTTPRYAFCEFFNPNTTFESPASAPPPLCLTLHHRAITDGRYKYIRKQEQSLACWAPLDASPACSTWPCANPVCAVPTCNTVACDASCTPRECEEPTFSHEFYDLQVDANEANDLGTSHAEFSRLSDAMDAISGS
ncbi:MAG: sulfatase-like hydrolase/transferase [Planctomycetota bacterium]